MSERSKAIWSTISTIGSLVGWVLAGIFLAQLIFMPGQIDDVSYKIDDLSDKVDDLSDTVGGSHYGVSISDKIDEIQTDVNYIRLYCK